MKLTRRTFTKYAASSSVVGGTSGAVSLGSRPALAAYSAEQISEAIAKMRGRSMVFVSWGGLQQDALRKAWLQPFAEKYGVKILEDGPPLNPKIVAMVRSGKPIWDVCDLAPFRLMSLGAAGCLEEADYNVADASNLPAELVLKWGMGACTYATILAYRRDMIKGEGPRSMTELWDLKRFPGKRALNDEPTNNLPFALNALGVAKDQIYPLTEEKIKRAFAKLDEIKDHAIWWTVGAQPTQLLADGEVAIAQGYNNRFVDVLKQGLPVQIVWEGGQSSATTWGIPKGAPNKDLAKLFIAWTLETENNNAISNYIPLGPANQKSALTVPAERRPMLPSSHINELIKLDANFWGAHFDELTERWQKWRLAG